MSVESKYVIRVITDCGKSDEDCFFVEYYEGIDENGGVILTDDLADAALFDDKEACDSIIDYLCVVLGYMPRTIERKRCFHVNPEL